MSSLQVGDEVKAKAEVYYGDELGQEKTKLLLQEVGLPRGLLPLKDIIECGYVKETGFVWMKQKKKVEHRFDKVGRMASYAPEVTAYVDRLRIRKLTGVKVKELMMWLTLSDITVDDPASTSITFKVSSGLFRIFPRAAFELPLDAPPSIPIQEAQQKQPHEAQQKQQPEKQQKQEIEHKVEA